VRRPPSRSATATTGASMPSVQKTAESPNRIGDDAHASSADRPEMVSYLLFRDTEIVHRPSRLMASRRPRRYALEAKICGHVAVPIGIVATCLLTFPPECPPIPGYGA
jgi:hypothetical protein